MVTIKDIARVAGVTYATVSRALNNGRGVSEATRANIRKIAEQMNYVPNLAAKRMVDRNASCIGLIWPRNEGLFYYHLSHCIQLEASRQGYRVMMSVAEPEDALRSFQEHFIDRVVHWLGVPETAAYLEAKQAFQGKLLEVGGSRAIQTPWLDIDRKGAVYKAVQHLVELGHRRIAFMGAQSDKLVGYTQGVIDCQLEYTPAEIVLTTDRHPLMEQKITEYLNRDRLSRATAIIIDSQGLAFEFAKIARAANVRIPEDFSLIVYDHVPEIQYLFDVQVTTVGPSMAELSHKLVDIMIANSDEQHNWGQYHDTVEAELIIRQSTQAPLSVQSS